MFFHAALHVVLLITYRGWPLGEYVIREGGITRGPGALRIGGSALGPAASLCSPISSFYCEVAIAAFPFPAFSLDCDEINTSAGSCLSLLSEFFISGGFLSYFLHFPPLSPWG